MEGDIALLTSADVMTREVVTVAPETPVPEIAQILHAKRISGVPVVAADGGVVSLYRWSRGLRLLQCTSNPGQDSGSCIAHVRPARGIFSNA
jgi:CBS domain-containing protein